MYIGVNYQYPVHCKQEASLRQATEVVALVEKSSVDT